MTSRSTADTAHPFEIALISPRSTGIHALRLALAEVGMSDAAVTTLAPANWVSAPRDVNYQLLIVWDINTANRALTLLPDLHAAYPAVPVIVITTQHASERQSGILRAGATECLTAAEVKAGALSNVLRRLQHRVSAILPFDLSELLDLAGDAIFVHDMQDRIIYWSRGAAETYGYTHDEALGRGVRDLLRTEFTEPLAEMDAALQAEGEYEGELIQVSATGERLVMWCRRVLKRAADGHPLMVLQFDREITARKRIENALASIALFPAENPNPVLRLSDDGELLYANAATEGLLAAEGWHPGERIPEELWDSVRAVLGGDASPEFEMVCRDGRVFSFACMALPQKGYINLYGRDVTEHRQAEDILRRYELLAAHSRDIILFLNRDDGRILEANAAAEAAYGYRREELLSRNLRDLRVPESYGLMAEQLAAADRLGALWETVHRRRDGSTFPVEVSSQGATIGGKRMLISVIRDITDRKRAESALHRSESELRLITDTVPVLISYIDADGRYRRVNRTYEEWVGRSAADIIGRSVVEVLGEAAWNTLHQLVERALAGETVEYEGEVEYARVGKRWVHATYTPDFDPQGRVRGFVVLVSDISGAKRAEDARRRSETILAQAGQMTHLGAWEIELLPGVGDNINDNPLRWSDEVYRIFGFKPGQVNVTNDLFFAHVHPDDRARIGATVAHALAEKQPYSIEHRIVRPDGAERIVYEHAEIICDEQGRPRHLIGAVQDITERKQAEEALRSSEARLRATFDCAGVGIAEADQDIRFTAVNDRICEILGYRREQLIGMTVHDLTAPEDRDLSDDRNARLLAGEFDRFNYEKRYLKRDGTPLWVRVNVAAVRDAAGRWLRFIATVEDIHERKRAEEALRRSEARFRSVFEEATIGILIVDSDYTIMDINPALQTILGYNLSEIRARGLEGISHPADAAASRAMFDELVAGRIDHYHIEKRYLCKDGGVMFGALTVFGIRDDRGHLLYTTGLIEDITLRREAEERIRRHNEELERLVAERTAQIQKLEQLRLESEKQAAVGRMAARIAHEINNPLAGIKNSFLLVKRAIPTEHQHYEFVGRIEKEIERVARIVRQMFELYKPERKEPSMLRPDQVIREVAELLVGNARAQGVSIEIDAAQAQQPLLLHEDSLRQILFSVIQNAIEATPMGGRIRIYAGGDEHTLYLDVTDQGPGISEELRSKIFEPFFTTKSEFTGAGLGLGLAITRGLVEAMNGAISFVSLPGQGTTFHITLPVNIHQSIPIT